MGPRKVSFIFLERVMKREIMKAFGLNGEIEPLSGGQNTSVKIGGYVLKPVDDSNYYEWVQGVFDQLMPKTYRISRPIRSIEGNYIVNGHMVCSFEPGELRACNIEEKLLVAKALHKDLNSLGYERWPIANDPWSRAHRIVWGDECLPEDLDGKILGILESLLEKLSVRTRLDFQIIHSDLYGNILFHDSFEPLVIDFSPTIGPPVYAEAIMICDGIAWEGCDLKYLDLIDEREMILRASLFRLITVAIFPGLTLERFMSEWEAYAPILEWYDKNGF